MLSVICSRLKRKGRLKRNTGNDKLMMPKKGHKEKTSQVMGRMTQRFNVLDQKGFFFPTLF